MVPLLAAAGAACAGGSGDVRLNEVQCRGDDWVELRVVEPGPLTGWWLTDDPEDPEDGWPLADVAVDAAAGDLVVVPPAGGEPLPFGIACGRDTLHLVRKDGRSVDSAAVGALPRNRSWARLPDGDGDWAVAAPTPGQPNRAPGRAAVHLNEISCRDGDWLEIVNDGDIPVDVSGFLVSDNAEDLDESYAIAAGTTLAPGAFHVVRRADGTREGFPFGLACGRDAAWLLDALGGPLDDAAPAALEPGTTWSRLPDGTGGWAPGVPTPGSANQAPGPVRLRLNEVSCRGEDWVEIVNASRESAALAGWRLSDDEDAEAAWALPAGVVLAPDERYVVARAGETEGFPFGLACGADTLFLLAPGGTPAETLALPALAPGTTWSRLPDGLGGWAPGAPTPGQPNRAPDAPARLAINEVSCQGEEWVELQVVAGGTLGGWRLTDDPTQEERGAEFVSGTAETGARLLLPRDLALPFGLACGSDVLQLVRPDGTVAETLAIPAAQTGRTWGRLPDGADAWGVCEPTPGEPNRPPDPSPVLLNEISCRGAADWVELVNVSDAAVALDGWAISQDPRDVASGFRFDAGELAAGARRTVARAGTDGVGLPFGVSCGRDSVHLVNASGVVADSAAPPDPGSGRTWSRLPDGGTDWSPGTPTPGEANRPPEPPAALVLNEVQCRGDEWIEVLATTGGALAGWRLTDDPARPVGGLVLEEGVAATGERLVFGAGSAVALPFGLACGVDTLRLFAPDGSEAEALALVEPPAGRTRARLPDGTGAWAEAEPTPGAVNRPPDRSALALNEISCRGADDWIEVRNVSAGPVDLAGWLLADDPTDLDDGHVLPAGVVEPGARAVIRRATAQAPGFAFGLACAADTVVLVEPRGVVADAATPAEVAPGRTWSRLPDGDGLWAEGAPTPDAPNRPPDPVAALALNEVGCRGTEFVELYATGAGALAGWRVTDDPTRPDSGLTIPSGTAGSGEVVLLPAAAGATDLSFGLACGADTLYLLRPDGSEAEALPVPDPPTGRSWARVPDGAGPWGAAEPTPGQWNRRPDPAPVVLNEISCRGDEDWVELVNVSRQTVSLAGWRLSDDRGAPELGYLLRAGTLAPGARTVLRRDSPAAAGFPFGLACGQDSVLLVEARGVLADEVALPELLPGRTWSRVPDGAGAWGPGEPTPEAPNRAADPPAALVLNEVRCDGDEWVELHVRTSGALGGWRLTDDPTDPDRGLVLQGGTGTAGRFVLLPAAAGATTLPFGLACGADTLHLLRPDGTEADRLAVGRPALGRSQGRFPDGTGAWTSTERTPGASNRPPAPSPVVLNEISCNGGDFVELVNVSGAPASLDGWTLGQSLDADEGYPIPAGTTLAPGAYLVLRPDGAAGPGFPFGLACGQDSVYLVEARGVLADSTTLPVLALGQTRSRLPDRTGAWAAGAPTPGAANRAPDPPATLVLNEVRCDGEEWVELVARTGGSLAGWRLTDAPADPRRGLLLESGTVATGGRVLLGEVAGAAAALPFGLACGTDTLHLLRPDGSEAERLALPEAELGRSHGRYPDATGAWTVTERTPGARNVLPPAPAVRLNEISCRGEDFVELVNVSSAAVDLGGWSIRQGLSRPEDAYAIPAGTWLQPGARALFRAATPTTAGLPFGLACGRDTVYLVEARGVVADSLALPETAAGQTRSRLPDGSGAWAAGDATPGAPNAAATEVRLLLNEVSCRDREWVELVSASAATVDAGGWAIDDDAEGGGWTVPDGTRVAPGGFVVLRQQNREEDGFTFAIACGVDTLYLRRPDGTTADSLAVPLGVAVQTTGRLPDATGAWRPTEPTPGAANTVPADPSAFLFDPLHVHRFDLAISAAGIASLRASPRVEVPADLTFTPEGGAAQAAIPVSVRIKGRIGSLRTIDNKAAFKVDINQYVPGQRFYGLKAVTLNNMVQDRSMLHEYATYSLFRGVGAPAPRIGYAWVVVNGAPYGLYATIETPDDDWLDVHFPSTQHLYEGLYGQDLMNQYVWAYEVDEGATDERGDLQALVDHAVAPPASAFYAASAGHVDWDAVTRVLAAEIFTGHWDGYGPTRNNYYFHFDQRGAVSLLPWGTDQTWSSHLAWTGGRGRLLELCRTSAPCLLRLYQAYDRIRVHLDANDLDAGIAAVAAVIAPHVAADPKRSYTVAQQQAAVASTRTYLAKRRADLRTWLACMLGPNADPDGDGFRCDADCRPTDPASYPGATEVCHDRVDNDCNGTVDDAPNCPDCVERRRGPHRYLFCTTPRAWSAADGNCRTAGGADYGLVQIDDAAENAWVAATARSITASDLWIGLSDSAVESAWRWADGHALGSGYKAWNAGEPNDAGGAEDCAHLINASGLWNDLGCTAVLPSVCEARCGGPGEPSDADGDGSPRCGAVCTGGTCRGDCDDGAGAVRPGATEICFDNVDQDCDAATDETPECPACTRVTRGPHAYHVCLEAASWDASRQRCRALGADLAVLDDAAESAWVWRQAVAVRSQNYWIGLADAAQEGEFRWVDASGLRPESFTYWAMGQPDDWNDAEDCGQLLAGTGEWADAACAGAVAAVCEAPCGAGAESLDADGDGFPRCGAVCNAAGKCGTDCDDADNRTSPAGVEVCGDGRDQDCDGMPDDGC